MKKPHDKHPTLPPDAGETACRALNEAEQHLASQSGIPEVLRPALLQAEANCRGNAGNVAPVASIDGRLCVKVPEHCEEESLFGFLWSSLVRSGGHSIQFAFAAEDDTLRVIYMNTDRVGYMASTPVRTANGSVRLGDWTVKPMPRRDGR
jgi:hypothetical protein